MTRRTIGRFQYLLVPENPSREVLAAELDDLLKEVVQEIKTTAPTLETRKEKVDELKRHVLPTTEDQPQDTNIDETLQQIEDRQRQIETTPRSELLGPVVQKLVEKSYKMLDKAGVKHQKVSEYFLEQDGLDVVIDVDPNPLRQAQIVFDWTIEKWYDRLKLNDKSLLASKHELNEVALEYCNDVYIAPDQQSIPNLLKAVATLQKADTHPRNYMPKPEAGSPAEAQDWALDLVAQMMSRHPDGRFEGTNSAIAIAKEDETNGNFPEGTAAKFEKFVKDLNQGEWQTLIKQNSSALQEGRKFTPSKKMVSKLIQELTDGRYKSNIHLTYTDDGYLLADLKAPFPLRLVFERVAGKVLFREIGVQICTLTFTTKDKKLAKDLLWADVNLGVAAGEAADSTISVPIVKEPIKDTETLVKTLDRELKKITETPVPSQEKIDSFKKLIDTPEKQKKFMDWAGKNPKDVGRFFSANDDLYLWMTENMKEFAAPIVQMVVNP